MLGPAAVVFTVAIALLICTVPFILLGVPKDIAIIPGFILFAVVVICWWRSSIATSGEKPKRRNVPGTGGNSVDDIATADSLDGKVDGGFNSFLD